MGGKAGKGGGEPASNGDVPWLVVRGASANNLKHIDVPIPLRRFTCVTGVSGSGKSTLVNEILHEALARDLNGAVTATPAAHDRIDGLEHLDKIIAIDQSPIGRTPRSNPATYIKLFDEIRALFTRLPDSRLRGYKPGRFSFNVPAGRGGGRCEACEGNGSNRIEMDFLADVWVTCPVCNGHRFTSETLRAQYKGRSIGDVLEMNVEQALELFENVPRIRGMLQTLHDVGLDYIQLGQASPTLSGGEAQRIKLARELVKKPTGRTIYVLDEPTTGLHFEDIRRLLAVLHGFVDAGNSVVVIEHNLDVIKTADWIIDLGPEGGDAGGFVVAAGTPEQVARHGPSHTGAALQSVLENGVAGTRRPEGECEAAGKRNGTADLPRSDSSDPHSDVVRVTGANQHNLKNLTVEFPRNQTTVCTGVSGSGKTSFAIDTVFAEGYRRYVESLSAFARQFLGQLAKPRVEHVSGLSPAICIEQKSAARSPRSTVGTVTEIYDYLRVLWARIGTPHCVKCSRPIGSQTVDEIMARVLDLPAGSPIMILAPLKLGDGEKWTTVVHRLKASGYRRVRVDGELIETQQAAGLDARRRHRVEVVVDRTVVRSALRGRLTESVEHALALGNGVMTVLAEAIETVDAPAGEHGVVAILNSEMNLEGEAGAGEVPTEAQRAGPPAADGVLRPSLSVQAVPARELRFSQRLACTHCGISYEELGPNHFSFNSPLGWCESCEGLGVQRGAPAEALIRAPSKSLLGGAVAGWGVISAASAFGKMLTALCERLGVGADTPLRDWPPEVVRALLFGTGGPPIDGSRAFPGLAFHWRGFFPALDAAMRNSWTLRHRMNHVVTDIPCTGCRGGRIRPEAAAVQVAQRSIVDVCELPLHQLAEVLANLRLDTRRRRIAGELLHEVRNRVQFLIDVGLEYLHLHRAAPTLSGGESQRIRLASQIGSGLTGVLYVLDEPTIGLHPRDNARLVRALRKLRDLGNTLLLVEHDREVIASADRLLDFGPGAGRLGGRLVAEGTPAEFARPSRRDSPPDVGEASESLTVAYLSGVGSIEIPANRRDVKWDGWAEFLEPPRAAPARGRSVSKRSAGLRLFPGFVPRSHAWMVLHEARHNNLKAITVPIPLARFTCVTGVSGSGKSSLVNDILWPVLANRLNHASQPVGTHASIRGVEQIEKVINVDQSAIGSTPSSNAATYTGVYDLIRELFARVPESKMRGYGANRFSFNRPGGRCEACEGNGQKKIEMHFMADVWVECESCRGRRFDAQTLEIQFKSRSIADVLEMSVDAALRHFDGVPKVRRMLQMLADVGLGYLPLGQSATTLSGGEAQRVKLAAELGKPQTGSTIYILDEPTTGLHFADVRKLLDVLHRLVDLGNTLVVVEHNLDIIKAADWLIDLGPEAGEAGGYLVAIGTPEELASGQATRRAQPAGNAVEPRTSHTAVALAPVLAAGPYRDRPRYDPMIHAAKMLAEQKAGFGDVGKEVRMPWQIDGRKWHLQQRASRNESPIRWQPAALEFVEQLVQKAGEFEPTNWANRASVEITATGASQWFLHALTGGEWLLELYFRVPPGTIDPVKLNKELGLKPLNEREDIQAYGDWPRVESRSRQDGLDAVVIHVFDRREIDTAAFRRFVKAATKAYIASVGAAAD